MDVARNVLAMSIFAINAPGEKCVGNVNVNTIFETKSLAKDGRNRSTSRIANDFAR